MATQNGLNLGLSGSTGTGTFVGANTPTLITPNIGAATGASLSISGSITSTGGAFVSGQAIGGIIGSLQLFPVTASKGYLEIVGRDNTANYAVQIQNTSFGQGSTLTIPDPGAASANFILSAGAGQTIGNGLTITTPVIAQINTAAGTTVATLGADASAINYLTLTSAAASGAFKFGAAGGDTDIGFNFIPKGAGQLIVTSSALTIPLIVKNGTSAQHTTNFTFANTSATRAVTFPDADGTVLLTGTAISTVPSIAFSSTSGVIGTTTNDNAAAGSVGQLISSVVSSGAPVALTNDTSADITSISLTAGDWDVYGNVHGVISTGTNYTQHHVWISATSATLPDDSLVNIITTTAASELGLSAPFFRASLSGTTTIYLSARTVFGGATMAACGGIYARRVR